jgi:hypothetical protein
MKAGAQRADIRAEGLTYTRTREGWVVSLPKRAADRAGRLKRRGLNAKL